MFPFLPPTMSRQVLTRDAQLRIKASAVDAEAVDVAVEAGVPRVPSRASRSRQRRLLRVPSLRAQVVVSPRGIFQMIGTKRSGLSGMLQVIGTKRSGLSGMLQLSGPKRSGLNGRRGPGQRKGPPSQGANAAVTRPRRQLLQSQLFPLLPRQADPDPSKWEGLVLGIMLPFMRLMRMIPSTTHEPLPVVPSPPSREAMPRRCGWQLPKVSLRRLHLPSRMAPEERPRQDSRRKPCAVRM